MKCNKIFVTVMAAFAMVAFTQCTNEPAANTVNESTEAPTFNQGLKIAYVDVDSLLSAYLFYQDLAEQMLKKEENSRLLLTEEAEKLQKDVEDFNRKLQNNVYSSQERVNQEQNRLLKKQQEFEELEAKLSNELMIESNKNAEKVSQAVNAFLKEYNKEKGFNLILSKATIMLADESMDITAEVIAGLNEGYKPNN
ncbi:MAG: OmpH family outer membrane protein [Bacteroidaceae bacterium]|nr:OmpH family outer membrane protein [Bacteroidaceae bacterium]